MKDIEQTIREVDATMAMEGMPLTNEDKTRLRAILEDRTTAEETVRRLVKKHTRKREPDYERV
jgi:citrate lyase gamma subunit